MLETTTLDLRNLTEVQRNDAVSESVAVHIAKWRKVRRNLGPIIGERVVFEDEGMNAMGRPEFATSADAVLPLLEKFRGRRTVKIVMSVDFHVIIESEPGYSSVPSVIVAESVAPTFPFAACLALLKAHGVEVPT